MAYEVPGRVIGTLFTTVDLSALQFTFVTLSTLGNVVGTTIFSDVRPPLGVLQNAPTAGQTCEVMVEGISKLNGTTAIVIGDLLGSTAGGKAVTLTSGTTGWVAAQALSAINTTLGMVTAYVFRAQHVVI